MHRSAVIMPCKMPSCPVPSCPASCLAPCPAAWRKRLTSQSEREIVGRGLDKELPVEAPLTLKQVPGWLGG
jgi:hypothetical protein